VDFENPFASDMARIEGSRAPGVSTRCSILCRIVRITSAVLVCPAPSSAFTVLSSLPSQFEQIVLNCI
jgi:hypothetical protein